MVSIVWVFCYVNDFIDQGWVKKVYLQVQVDVCMNLEDLVKWYICNDVG